MQFTERELATLLAALRAWQQRLLRRGTTALADWPQFEKSEPLSVEQIDELCERLNCA